ncbi:MAG: hypothetical protein GQ583_08425 [Methyloprofundus sp.]|nr:hypothetical protein [Methyloprofundus sp.]
MKNAENFINSLNQGKGKKKDFDTIMKAHIQVFPEYKNQAEQSKHLRELLDYLASIEKIQLPSPKGKSWRDGNPKLPIWVNIIITKSISTSIPTDYAWHPKLAFFVDSLNIKQKEAAFSISEYFINETNRGKFDFLIPRRERSLKIFNDEKKLDKLSNKGKLLSGNLSLEDLGCYDVGWPMPYKQPPKPCPNKPFLIIENHHTFTSFSKWNEKSQHYSGIGYGAGEAFSSLESDRIEDIVEPLNASEIHYFGDIDPKGINIPTRVSKARVEKDLSPILPAINLYKWLLKNGIQRPILQGKQQKYIPGWFPASLEKKINQLFSEGWWFPQEALGSTELQAGISKLYTNKTL